MEIETRNIDEKRLYQMILQVVQCLSLLLLYSFSMSFAISFDMWLLNLHLQYASCKLSTSASEADQQKSCLQNIR